MCIYSCVCVCVCAEIGGEGQYLLVLLHVESRLDSLEARLLKWGVVGELVKKFLAREWAILSMWQLTLRSRMSPTRWIVSYRRPCTVGGRGGKCEVRGVSRQRLGVHCTSPCCHLYRTLARSSSRTLLETFSASAQVVPTISHRSLASWWIFCSFGLRSRGGEEVRASCPLPSRQLHPHVSHLLSLSLSRHGPRACIWHYPTRCRVAIFASISALRASSERSSSSLRLCRLCWCE